MSDIKSLIANARKNLPQLKQLNDSDTGGEIVLIDGSSRSVIDKLNRHRNKKLPEDKQQKEDAFKWLKMKEKMIIDMEHKRDEEWKMQTLNDKLDNEEVDELLGNDADGDSDSHSDNDAQLETEDQNSELHSEGESKAKSDFFNDQAEEENEEDDFSDQSDNELFSLSKNKPKIIDDEDETDFGLTDNHDQIQDDENDDGFELPSQYSQNGDKFYISQNLPLTPLFAEETKEPTKALPFDSTDTNSIDNFDSQLLANLCSGQFEDFSAHNEIVNSEVKVDSEIGLNETNEGSDESSESNTDDDDELDDHEENESEQICKVKPKRTNQFIEDEAELSGSEGDVSSDENDDEDEDELDREEIQEDLPSDDELKDQVERIYNKDILDEDKRQLMILKEMFFDDGDLHEEDGDRKKKFRWQLNNDMDDFINVLSDSEEEASSNESGLDEDKPIVRLKRETNISEQQILVDSSAESGEVTVSKSVTVARSRTEMIRSSKLNKKQSTKISSFFIKDERLKDILNKRPANSTNDTSSKRQKTQESTSIFDLLNC